MNLSVISLDRLLENELANIFGKIRGLEENKQRLSLSGLKGMLDGLES